MQSGTHPFTSMPYMLYVSELRAALLSARLRLAIGGFFIPESPRFAGAQEGLEGRKESVLGGFIAR